MIELLTVFLLVVPVSEASYTVYGHYYHQDLCNEIAVNVNKDSAEELSCVELNFVVEMPNLKENVNGQKDRTERGI